MRKKVKKEQEEEYEREEGILCGPGIDVQTLVKKKPNENPLLPEKIHFFLRKSIFSHLTYNSISVDSLICWRLGPLKENGS